MVAFNLKFNFQKKHLFFLILFIGIIIGVIVVNAYNPSGTGGTPLAMGHSVDEMDWSKPIVSGVAINGRLGVGPGVTAPSNTYSLYVTGNSYNTQDIVSAGQIIATGNIVSSQDIRAIRDVIVGRDLTVGVNKFYGDRGCRDVTPSGQPVGGSTGRFTMNVPSECIDGKCLIYINGGDFNFFYSQGTFNIPSDGNVVLWESSGVSETNPTDGQSSGDETAGRNGDSITSMIFRRSVGSGTWIEMYDDLTGAGGETSSTQWSFISDDWNIQIYVCKA